MNLREDIAQAILTGLQEIQDPRLILVTREPFDVEKLAITQFPALLIKTGSEERLNVTMGESQLGRRTGKMTITITGFVRGTDLDTKRNEIINAVEKAIDLDQNWGLKSSGVLGSQIILIEVIDRAPPLAEVKITMIVNYNYLRN
jgi:Cu/Ag efflux pump CusA